MIGSVEVGRLVRAVPLFSPEAWNGPGIKLVEISKTSPDRKQSQLLLPKNGAAAKPSRKRKDRGEILDHNDIGKQKNTKHDAVFTLERKLTFLKQLPTHAKVKSLVVDEGIAIVKLDLA